MSAILVRSSVWRSSRMRVIRRSCNFGETPREFNLRMGLALAGMCGVFSSGMSFAIDAARPSKQHSLAPWSESHSMRHCPVM